MTWRWCAVTYSEARLARHTMDSCRSDGMGVRNRSARRGGTGDIPSVRANRCRGREPRDTARGRVVGGRITAGVAVFLLATLTLVLPVACSGEARQERINRIIQCKSQDIQQVVLLPLESHVPLVAKPLTVKDRAAIKTICQSLNSASEFRPNHPSIKWEVKVEIRTQKGSVAFVVYHTEQENNGTVVSIMSHVTSGWNYGRFRSDSLGPILENLAERGNEVESAPGKGRKRGHH